MIHHIMYQHWGLCVIVELERGTANMTARSSFIHICSEIPATRFAQRSKSDYSEVIQIWFVEKRNPKIMLQNFQRTTLNTNNAETKLWSLTYYKKNIFFTSLLKVKFYTDKVRRALGSGGCLFCLFVWLIVTILKNLKTALFQTFSTWHPNTFCLKLT